MLGILRSLFLQVRLRTSPPTQVQTDIRSQTAQPIRNSYDNSWPHLLYRGKEAMRMKMSPSPKKQQTPSPLWPSPLLKSEAGATTNKCQNAAQLYRKTPLNWLKQPKSTTISIKIHRALPITASHRHRQPLITPIYRTSQECQIEMWPLWLTLTPITPEEWQLTKTSSLRSEGEWVPSL